MPDGRLDWKPGPAVNGRPYYADAKANGMYATIARVMVADAEYWELTIKKNGMTKSEAILLANQILGGEYAKAES